MKYLILSILITTIGFAGNILAYQPKPVDFWFNQEGEAFGTLEDGTSFSQINIATDLGIRLQKFQWGDLFWYVSDRGVIYADCDLQALSIYLAL